MILIHHLPLYLDRRMNERFNERSIKKKLTPTNSILVMNVKQEMMDELIPEKNIKQEFQDESTYDCSATAYTYQPSRIKYECDICEDVTVESYWLPTDISARTAFLNRLQLPSEQIQGLINLENVRVCPRHFHPTGVMEIEDRTIIIDTTYLITENPPIGWPNQASTAMFPVEDMFNTTVKDEPKEVCLIPRMEVSQIKAEPEDEDYRRSEMMPREELLLETTYKRRVKKCNICKEELEGSHKMPLNRKLRIEFLKRLLLPMDQIESLIRLKNIQVCHRHFHPDGLVVVGNKTKIMDRTWLVTETPPITDTYQPEASKAEAVTRSNFLAQKGMDHLSKEQKLIAYREQARLNESQIIERIPMNATPQINTYYQRQKAEESRKRLPDYLSTDSISIQRALPTPHALLREFLP